VSDQRDRYGYCLTFSGLGKGKWHIYDNSRRYSKDLPEETRWMGEIILELEDDENWMGDGPPPHVRKEYERIIGFDKDAQSKGIVNIVEILADDASGFNQVCKYGYLVDGHSVYCHNDSWLYAPRKCRRTWYTGGETKDEDCEGFSPR
jgi:hypothetical protein